MNPSPPTARSVPWVGVAVAPAAYLLAVALGRLLTLQPSQMSMFWPAAGVAALWLLSLRSWRAVALATGFILVTTAAGNVLSGYRPGPAVLGGCAHAVLALAFGWVYGRVHNAPAGFQPVRRGAALAPRAGPRLHSPRDFLDLVVAAVIATAASIVLLVGVTVWQTGTWQWAAPVMWVVRNTTGILAVCAVVLCVADVLARRRRLAGPVPRSWWRGQLSVGDGPYVAAELGVLVLVSAVTVGFVFAPDRRAPLAFLVVAIGTWAGYRFRPVVAALHSVPTSIAVIGCTVAGWGPFGALDEAIVRATVVQGFTALTSTVALLLSLGVEERHRLTQRLQSSEAQARDQLTMLRAVADAITDGLVVADRDGRILMLNSAAEAFGSDGDRTMMASPNVHGFFRIDGTAIPESDLPHVRVLRGETVSNELVLHVHPDTGVRSTISVSVARLERYGEAGAADAVVLLHDVTEHHHRMEELERFAGVVAHDLKNPLTTVTLWSEVLREELQGIDPDVAEPAQSAADWIEASATRMWQLIDDLLAFTRSGSGALRLQELDLDRLVGQVIAEVRATPDGAEATFDRGHLGLAWGDPTLVKQVLSNLVGNAVKYVAPGVAPHVRLATRRTRDGIEITVADNGIGIPNEARARVFDPFFRATGGGYSGTGLGLAICKRAVERHGGTISAGTGPDGHGSAVTFTLPGVVTAAAAAEPSGAAVR